MDRRNAFAIVALSHIEVVGLAKKLWPVLDTNIDTTMFMVPVEDNTLANTLVAFNHFTTLLALTLKGTE